METQSLIGILCLFALVAFFRWRSQQAQRRVRGQWETAIAAFEAADYTEAEQQFRKCIADAPVFLHARWMLAETLARQNRLDEAEQELETATAFEPRNPEAHLSLGMFHALHRGNPNAAVAAFTEAVRLEPDLRRKLAHEPRLKVLDNNPGFEALVRQDG